MAHAEVAATPHLHEVFFYDLDGELADAVADYVRTGLADGEPVIVLATAAHLAAIEAALVDAGVDVARARARGAYLALDAADVRDSFMVDGVPDADRFTAVVGEMLDAAEVDGTGVRVFGEMVALLWQQGNVAGAIALETLWNEIAQHREFSLLCAYPTTALGAADLGDVNQLCHLHSALIPPPSYGSASGRRLHGVAGSALAVFVAVPEAVSAARRFVKETLTSWGENHLVWDGALIVSELATNAIIHGGSAFRASIERTPQVVRIAVEDVGPGLPQSRRMFEDALGGRGVAMVEELSRRWGCDPIDGGKVIWVELEAATGRPR